MDVGRMALVRPPFAVTPVLPDPPPTPPHPPPSSDTVRPHVKDRKSSESCKVIFFVTILVFFLVSTDFLTLSEQTHLVTANALLTHPQPWRAHNRTSRSDTMTTLTGHVCATCLGCH